MSAVLQRHALRTADGALLDVLEGRVSGPSKGVVILLHAMMADRRSMRHVAAALWAQGFDTVAASFRGRGPTSAYQRRDWSYDDLVAFDVPTVVDHARRMNRGPVSLVGHSLGGHVTTASLASGRCTLDGLVLVGSNIWLPRHDDDRVRRQMRTQALRAMASMVMLYGRVPARSWGVGSADEAASYAADLKRYWSTNQWVSRDGTIDYLERARHIDLPVLVVVSRDDALLGHRMGAMNFAKEIGDGKPDIWFAGRGSGGIEAPLDHMGLCMSKNAGPLWCRAAEWIASATAT